MITEDKTSPRHIYLADDDEDDRILFAEALSEIDSSAVLTQAENGKQLMDILSIPTNPLPEVIFLDINMPKLNGFECLEKIRKENEDLKNVQVIIFTTSNNPATVEKAFELGASFYAVKPNSFKALKSLIDKILQIDWFSATQEDRKFQLIDRKI